MREKLLKLMENEKLTASRLAELLGIRSSGISHIISGRNKPSYDLLQKILRRFPQLNPDWLLLESDQMYRTTATTVNVSENPPLATSNLFGSSNGEEKTPTTTTLQNENPRADENPNIASIAADGEHMHSPYARRAVRRIIVLYDDNTFESYNPR